MATQLEQKKTRSKQVKLKSRPNLDFERAHLEQGRICVGVDEVGRGCLAGPVVTAAVVLPESILNALEEGWWSAINDSKLVSPVAREKLSVLLLEQAQVQVAWCLPEEIDRWNILHAAMIAMRRALGPFSGLAKTVLVDGNADPFHERYRCKAGLTERLGFEKVETLVKGDQRSLSIAAASIVAKVYRDRWMTELDKIFPGYGFAVHKGYSMPEHYRAIEKFGACAIHRMSFDPFKSANNRVKV